MKDIHEDQIEYLGRWVDKKYFRAFVYNKDSEEKLADSYEEYEKLLASGLWFAEKQIEKIGKDTSQKRAKNDFIRAVS